MKEKKTLFFTKKMFNLGKIIILIMILKIVSQYDVNSEFD